MPGSERTQPARVMPLCVLALALAVTDASLGQGPVRDGSPNQALAAAPAPALIAGLPEEAGIAVNSVGFCLDLGCGDGALAAEIARKTRYTVFAVAKDDADCAKARRTLDEAGLYGTRAAAVAGSLKTLPFPDGYGNLIVTGEYSGALDLQEVLRVLNPNGLAVIGGGTADAEKLKAALDAAGIKGYRIDGHHAIFRGRMPRGADDWTHMRHGPDNNRVCPDASLRPPFRTQWLSSMPPNNGDMVFTTCILAAQGRLLRLKGVNKDIRLCAYDAFNGTPLWLFPAVRKNYPLLMTGVAAVGDRVYAAIGDRAVALDAATGETVTTYEVGDDADIRGVWAWLAVEDDMLLAQAEGAKGKAAYPHSKGEVFFAFDLKTGKLLWKHRCEGLAVTDTAAIGGGALYYRDEAAGAVALDLKTGRPRWANPKLAGDLPFKDWMCQTIRLAGVYGNGKIHFICGDSSVMLDATDGRILWEKKTRPNFQYPAFLGEKMYGLVSNGGGQVVVGTIDPATGEVTGKVGGAFSGCGVGVYSAGTIFNAGQGFAALDLATGRSYSPGRLTRSPCGNGPLPSQGLLFFMPMRCGCLYPVRLPMAMAPAGPLPDARVDLEGRLAKGPAFDSPLAAAAPAQEWPCWRGGMGHTGQTDTALRGPLQIGWRQKLSGSLTPPSAGGGMVYVGSKEGFVWALDEGSGQVRWKFACGGEVPVTPTFARGRVLVGSADGCVYCLDAGTGQVAWRFRAAPQQRYIHRLGSMGSAWPVDSGVVVDDGGAAYFAAGSLAYDGVYLYAADVATGKVRWAARNDSNCAGPIALAGGLLIVPGSAQNENRAFKTADGSPVPWYQKSPACAGLRMGYASVHASEVVADGAGYLGGGLARYRGGAVEPYVMCESQTGFAAGWVAAVRERPFPATPRGYPFPGPAPPILTPDAVIFDGLACDRSRIASLNVQGAIKGAGGRKQLEDNALWWVRLWPQGSGQRLSSQVLAGDVLLAAGTSEVVAFEARKDGKELARVKVEGTILRNGLAVAGGQVVVVTREGGVYCLPGR
ncbi:MAG TPA: PQQ-binding-like beta-propeller repeat protein [Phycisphaerae bacterium]|nr:PQQ-binding-like beta-propeller repeat protein [Phycisphaerae bacterium]